MGDVVPRRPQQRWRGNASALRRSLGFLAILTMSFACSVAAAAEVKRVVLLHSYGRDFKPWKFAASWSGSRLGPWTSVIFR